MRKTLFRPSIHGWPFGNSYDLSILVDEFHLENVGFCGGMCWLALERFYAGTRVPRDLGLPKKGQALYEELKNEQFDSLDVGKVLRMLKWQSSPRMTNGTSILDSLGKRTQSEWPDVKKRIDGGRPVTITLITNANEPNPLKLIENHRVVVYGYDIRDVPDGEGIRGDWNSNIKHVTLNVYDPNYPNNDEVNITFYTGCDDDWIKIRHNRGDSVAGFFLDDVDRKYSYGDESDLQITKCAPLGISSFSEARCRISLSWTCKVIPFFRVLIDGSAWKMNSQLKGGLAPFGKEFKQCDSRSGSMTIDVTVPRAECVLSVQLLDGDFARTRSVHLDMRPQALCRPYIRSRASSETMSIAEKNHRDSDLFVKDPSPDSAAIASMDDGPMRWIFLREEKTAPNHAGSAISKPLVFHERKYQLGNVVSPVHADFELKNLAAPVTISTTTTRYLGGNAQGSSVVRTGLGERGEKIFDGFQSNPADYDNDVTVKIAYSAKDRFGVTVPRLPSWGGRCDNATRDFLPRRRPACPTTK